jgi:hypothetical protein
MDSVVDPDLVLNYFHARFQIWILNFFHVLFQIRIRSKFFRLENM